MKTLYEILEVSENASNEIIEKAYKVLAKKYHPDLQSAENKESAEKKMKEINEAYEVLGDIGKRRKYDNELERLREEEKRRVLEQQKYVNYNNTANNQTNVNYHTNTSKNMNYNKAEDMQRRRYEEKLRKQMEANLQQEYENAYYNYLRSLGYKIKERWTWKRTKDLLITFAILTIIFIALWFIPPTHDMLVGFYENNKIVKIIVDIVANIITAVFKTIGSLFTGAE